MKPDNPRSWRRIAAVAATLTALLAASFAAAPAFAAQPPPVAKYVALGDSYAAGQGAGGYLDSCLRTPNGYAGQLDTVPRYNLLRQPACSGATIQNVLDTQLSQLNRGTTLVTVTAGANDLGLSQVFAACTTGDAQACAQAVGTAQATIMQIGARMDGLIAAIQARAPKARIVVTGYPIPFEAAIAPDGSLLATVDAATAALNAQLSGATAAMAATGADVVYAPVDFAGHAIGSAEPLLGQDPADSVTFLHPTAAGYTVYRNAILAALN